MNIINSANGVKIDLRVHEISGEHQGFGRLNSPFLDSKRGLSGPAVFAGWGDRKNSKRVRNGTPTARRFVLSVKGHDSPASSPRAPKPVRKDAFPLACGTVEGDLTMQQLGNHDVNVPTSNNININASQVPGRTRSRSLQYESYNWCAFLLCPWQEPLLRSDVSISRRRSQIGREDYHPSALAGYRTRRWYPAPGCCA